MNVYSAISSGSAQNCRLTVARTRLLHTSLTYVAMTMVAIPMNDEGMLRRFVCVVVKPRFRSDSVRYNCGGPTGTGVRVSWLVG